MEQINETVETTVAETSQSTAEKMADCNVSMFNVTELSIIAAIKKGFNTLETIESETTLKQSLTKSVIDQLVMKDIIICIPGSEADSYMMKIVSDEPSKKLKLGGNLLLPVSSIVDHEGQKYVCRGSWHKIADDIDILNDIDWFDNTDTETQMKTVMKSVTEKKKKQTEAKQKNDIASDGPATPEDEKYSKRWNNISDTMKMYVYAVSATRATVGFSARIVTPQGEFPFGCISETTAISIEDYRKYIANEIPDAIVDYNKILVITSKNNFPAELIKDGEVVKQIRFYELKPNKGGETISASEKYIVLAGDGKFSIKNGKNNVDINPVDVPKFIASECPLIDGIYKAQQPAE